MEALKKLQHLSLVSNVVQELDNHFGMNDKVLAEFIIDLAKRSNSYDEYKKSLDDNGANFNEQFSSNLYKLITKMDPKNMGSNQNANVTNTSQPGKEDDKKLSNREVARTIEEE